MAPPASSSTLARTRDWRIPTAWITLCIVWSSTWLAIKFGLRDLPPVSYAGIRFVIAVLVLLAVSVGRVPLLPAQRSDFVFEFGGNAMLLALASYNRGENGVRRALKQLDDPFSDRSYWRLVDEGLLPEETADYVPRFMAAAVAGEGGMPSPQVLEAAGYGESPVGE